MNVQQMKSVLKEILTRTDLTPCVVGHRGVGKTAGIIQVCREIGRRYVPLRLGQMEVGDLVGIPYRINVGKKSASGIVELVTRTTSTSVDVPLSDVVVMLKERVQEDGLKNSF